MSSVQCSKVDVTVFISAACHDLSTAALIFFRALDPEMSFFSLAKHK